MLDPYLFLSAVSVDIRHILVVAISYGQTETGGGKIPCGKGQQRL